MQFNLSVGRLMNTHVTRWSALVSMGFILTMQAHAQQCSNASMNGTYFGTFGGAVVSGSSSVAHQDLGKVIADGNGVLSGQATTSIAGVVSTQTLSGSYSIKTNCSGTGTLSSNGITIQFALQLVN